MGDMHALIIIFLVAVGTYSLRLSGLLLSNRFVQSGRVKLFLDYLPPTLLLSLVAPALLKEGLVGLVAAFIVALTMIRTSNTLLSMVLGVVIVAVGRHITLYM